MQNVQSINELTRALFPRLQALPLLEHAIIYLVSHEKLASHSLGIFIMNGRRAPAATGQPAIVLGASCIWPVTLALSHLSKWHFQGVGAFLGRKGQVTEQLLACHQCGQATYCARPDIDLITTPHKSRD